MQERDVPSLEREQAGACVGRLGFNTPWPLAGSEISTPMELLQELKDLQG